MRPIKSKTATGNYGAPRGLEAGIGGLPFWRETNDIAGHKISTVYSAWKFEPWEIEVLAKGGALILGKSAQLAADAATPGAGDSLLPRSADDVARAAIIRNGHLVVAGHNPTTVVAEEERVAPVARKADVLSVIEAIQDAAAEFGIVDYAWLMRFQGTAYCESRYDTLAVGAAGERGLWQFMPTTWAANAPALGYGPDDVWSARASSRVAAYMMAELGQGPAWTCWRKGYEW